MQDDYNQSKALSSFRAIILSEEQILAENLRNGGCWSCASSTARSSGTQRDPTVAPPLQIVCVSNGKDILDLIMSAQSEQMPFNMVVLDCCLLLGKDYLQILNGLWGARQDIYIVLHSVSQIEEIELLQVEVRFANRLLALKYRLTTFEIYHIICMVAKFTTWNEADDRHLNLNSQLLEMIMRFEEVSNRLRFVSDHHEQFGQQLFQSQEFEVMRCVKYAAVHFFYNYLNVVQKHLNSILGWGQSLVSDLVSLQGVTRHSYGVLSQLLSFCNREYQKPSPTHLDRIIDAQANLIQNTLGKNISIHINHLQDTPCVMADEASLERVVFNLIVHISELMPKIGSITIQTLQFFIPDEVTASQVHVEARPGRYVVMMMSNTGGGMEFTGTSKLVDDYNESCVCFHGVCVSMTLATVMVRLLGGWITINNIPGGSSEYAVYLPESTSVALPPHSPKSDCKPLIAVGDKSTILVVDDEDSVRQIIEYVLTSQGHKVLCARDAADGWALWRKHCCTIKLAIIDVKLPDGVSGFDLENAIANEDSSLPVIFTCGYSPTGHNYTRKLKVGDNFLPKPFGVVELLNIVNNALLRVSGLLPKKRTDPNGTGLRPAVGGNEHEKPGILR